MLQLIVAVALAADVPQTQALKALSGLAGCWKAPGQVRGKDSMSVARGEWRMGGRYFILHLRSLAQKDSYEAAIIYGGGKTPEAIVSYWLDTYGGEWSIVGSGSAGKDGFSVDYHYPDSVYPNHFAPNGAGWRWTIMERRAGKPETLFGQYDLTPASCKGMNFTF